MKIEFNADNARELTAVGALIQSLGAPVAYTAKVEVPSAVAESVDSTPEEAADAAEAFAGNPPSGTPSAAAPPAPTETPTPAPASPTAPGASLSNGEIDITANLVPSTGPTEGALMNPNGVEVDKAGLPYDARIHTKTPKMKKDGFWTNGRGVDKELVRTVTAELKKIMAAGGNVPAAPSADAAAPAPAAEPVNTESEAAAATTAASTPPAPPAATPPVPPVTQEAPAAPVQTEGTAPETGPVTDFAGLMKKVTGMQTANLLDVTQVSEIAVSLGLTGIKDLIKRPDLVAAFDALLPEAA